MLKSFTKLFVWEVVNPALLRLRRSRMHVWNPAWHGLNLGCGLDVLPNWVGIDGGVYLLFRNSPSLFMRWGFRFRNMSEVYTFDRYVGKLKSLNVIYHDLGYGIPFRTAEVPNIYSSHFVEHLTAQDAERLMQECFRVLQPGGVIRIAVPSLENEVNDMRAALQQFERGNNQPVMRYLTSQPGFTDRYSVHRYMYNFGDMENLLRFAGFGDVTERTYRCGRMIDVDKLDTREKSLFVEAAKG